jgi:uncharacterized protein YutD
LTLSSGTTTTTTTTKKKEGLLDDERYQHMVNYLDHFENNKEAKPMINKIKNSDDYIKLYARFGNIIFSEAKKKRMKEEEEKKKREKELK